MTMVSCKAEQSLFVANGWVQFEPDNIPDTSGVYGIWDDTAKEWFYIGKSQNIAKRLTLKTHPFHIALSINSREFLFFYQTVPDGTSLSRLENRLMKTCAPIGNGATSWGGYIKNDPIKGIRRVTPHGLCCDAQIERDIEAQMEIFRQIHWEPFK